MNVVVIGYPYARPNFRAALEAMGAYFILPRIWKIKGGKAEYHTAQSSHILTTWAPFYHSNYPLIGGLLKGWMPMFPWLLWQLKHKHDIRLVFEAHEPTLLTTLYHGIWAKILGVKHVVFSWENISFENKLFGIRGAIHRLLLSVNLILADGVVCGNEKCLTIFRKLTNKPLAVIPLAGLDPNEFNPPIERPQNKIITFVFAGAIDYRKGLHVLLSAFKKLMDENLAVKLVLIGSGTYEKEIDQQISEFQIPVTRLPWIDHVKLIEMLSRSDIFVYPSVVYGGWEEQFGYSMAEASLMELPVISTLSGSIQEVVKDKETGILVEPGDIQQLTDAMRTLATDPRLRQAYGLAGRTFIVQKFSNEVISKKYKDFFKSLIQ